MIIGIGIDILKVSRVNEIIKRRGLERIGNKILSPLELAQLADHGAAVADPGLHSSANMYIATRFAAKEAIFKAISVLARPTWKQVSVLRESQSGRPVVWFHFDQCYSAAACAPFSWGLGRLSALVSISHEQEYVVASAVVSQSPPCSNTQPSCH